MAAVDGFEGNWARESDLDRKFQSSRDTAGAISQLALIVDQPDQPSRREPSHRRQCTVMPRDSGEPTTRPSQAHEQDAAARRRPGLLLVGLGQLGLDHLTSLHLAQRADERRIQDERDRKRDLEREGVEDQACVSSLTTSSRRPPWDALTSTLSPSWAFLRTQSAAARRSATSSAPADSASTGARTPSTTQTASKTSAARRPTRRWDSSDIDPSSAIWPSTASRRPRRGLSASASNAASMDSGLALYASSTIE